MAKTVPVEVRVADLKPIKRLIAGAEKMATYEHAGGDGWWEGWAEVRAALNDLRGAAEPAQIDPHPSVGCGGRDLP